MSILGQLGLGTVALRLLFSLWGQKRGPCARVTPGSPRTHTSNSRCQGGPEPSGWEWIHVILEDPSSPSGVPSHSQGIQRGPHTGTKTQPPQPLSSPPSSSPQSPSESPKPLILSTFISLSAALTHQDKSHYALPVCLSHNKPPNSLASQC